MPSFLAVLGGLMAVDGGFVASFGGLLAGAGRPFGSNWRPPMNLIYLLLLCY